MWDSILETLSSQTARSGNRGINSKIELKVKLIEMSQATGMDYDTLLDKFKVEYEALPISNDDSIKKIIIELSPMFIDIVQSIKCQYSDNHFEDKN